MEKKENKKNKYTKKKKKKRAALSKVSYSQEPGERANMPRCDTSLLFIPPPRSLSKYLIMLFL
jgi:hypothetical protein